MRRQKTSKRFRTYRCALKALSSAYPAAFPPKGRRPPLAVGVVKDILGRRPQGLTATQVRIFLQVWTTSTAYLTSVARGGDRVRLDGRPAGPVSTSHAEEARARVSERRKRIQSKRLTDSIHACSDSANRMRCN